MFIGRKKVGGRDLTSITKGKAEVMEGALPKVKTTKVKLVWQHYNEDKVLCHGKREHTRRTRDNYVICEDDFSLGNYINT